MNYKKIKPYICRERYTDIAIKELVAMLPAIIARSVHTLTGDDGPNKTT
jgi:hypothetical protein